MTTITIALMATVLPTVALALAIDVMVVVALIRGKQPPPSPRRVRGGFDRAQMNAPPRLPFISKAPL
jgi:hypothetical protein